MVVIWSILAAIPVATITLFFIAACKVAKRADEQSEKYFQEMIEEKSK